MAAPINREARMQRLLEQGLPQEQAAAVVTQQSTDIRQYLSMHPDIFTNEERSALVRTWTTMQYQMIASSLGCWVAWKTVMAVYPKVLGRFGVGLRYSIWLGVVIGPSVAVYQVKKTSMKRMMDSYIDNHWDEVSHRLQSNP